MKNLRATWLWLASLLSDSNLSYSLQQLKHSFVFNSIQIEFRSELNNFHDNDCFFSVSSPHSTILLNNLTHLHATVLEAISLQESKGVILEYTE